MHSRVKYDSESFSVSLYRSTRRRTTGMLEGTSHVVSIDGSEPSGAGPMAGRPGSSFGGVGVSHGMLTERCSSMRSRLMVPLKLLSPDLKLTRSPSILPSTIALGTSSPPKKPAPPSTVPVNLPPSCWSVNTVLVPTIMEMKSLDDADGSRLHNPVMPDPVGTSRCHTAICGLSFASFAAMVRVAETRPGDAAARVMFPGALADCTSAMQKPENPFREVPLSDA